MAVEVGVKVDSTALRTGLEKLRLALPLGGDMTPAMQAIGRALKTAAQLRFRTGRGPDGSAWAPSRRAQESGGQTLNLTRKLRNSITFAATRTSATVGTNDIRAAIHHFGGVIRAKKGPFLSIPVTDAARRAGGARNFPAPLHVAQTLKGLYILVDSKGQTQYILRPSVTMPARPFLGVSDADETELLGVMSRHLANAWRGGG